MWIIYMNLKNNNMTTNFDYNQLQQWSNSELIEQILLLQDFINKEVQCNTPN